MTRGSFRSRTVLIRLALYGKNLTPSHSYLNLKFSITHFLLFYASQQLHLLQLCPSHSLIYLFTFASKWQNTSIKSFTSPPLLHLPRETEKTHLPKRLGVCLLFATGRDERCRADSQMTINVQTCCVISIAGMQRRRIFSQGATTGVIQTNERLM